MIPAEVSGVTFTVHLTNENVLLIEYTSGTGELLVSGEIMPNSAIINRSSLEVNKNDYDDLLSDEILKEFAKIFLKIESVFGTPQDIEWCYYSSNLWILQSRPITHDKITSKKGDKGYLLVLKGIPASGGTAEGKVKIIHNPKTNNFEEGKILVASAVTTDYTHIIVRASAVVTDIGGKLSHAAVISRELGIPAVVNTKEATKKLNDGDLIIVDGDKGEVYLI